MSSGLKSLIHVLAKEEDAGGAWRTINGTPVFIKEGQSVADAIEKRFDESPKKESSSPKAPSVDKGGKVVRFKSGAQADKLLKDSASQWSEGDGYFDNKVVKDYAGTSDSFLINKYLRTGQGDKSLKDKANALAKVLDKTSFPMDAEVVRSINPKTPEERAAILKSFSVGDEFKDPAFTSTTANVKYADEWASKFKADPIKVTVEIPKGAKAAYLPKETVGKQEWEVLIQRGSTYRVKSVEGSHVTLELRAA